jgi:hypothetical protein
MNPFDSETLRLILIFFVPGFISIKVYDLLVPSERRDFSESLFEAISFSCVNFALTYWAIVAIHSDNFQINYPICYYISSIIILFVTPTLLPIIYLKILSMPFFKNKTIHPMPKPWDYVFSQQKPFWVIVHLKDGRRIGGLYGENSFASSYPANEQIYLEGIWNLDEKGKFLERIERSEGIILSKEDFEVIEFFKY